MQKFIEVDFPQKSVEKVKDLNRFLSRCSSLKFQASIYRLEAKLRIQATDFFKKKSPSPKARLSKKQEPKKLLPGIDFLTCNSFKSQVTGSQKV